ncbi:hypothetical protein GQ600_5763 [Phytophthora cactorum]|nr:hypothetical protein GQ600_5763 [Phytophthora cactorum]
MRGLEAVSDLVAWIDDCFEHFRSRPGSSGGMKLSFNFNHESYARVVQRVPSLKVDTVLKAPRQGRDKVLIRSKEAYISVNVCPGDGETCIYAYRGHFVPNKLPVVVKNIINKAYVDQLGAVPDRTRANISPVRRSPVSSSSGARASCHGRPISHNNGHHHSKNIPCAWMRLRSVIGALLHLCMSNADSLLASMWTRTTIGALLRRCNLLQAGSWPDVVENHDRGVVMPLRDDCQPAVGLSNGKRCGDGDVKLLSMYSHGLEARQRSLQRSASQLNLADRMRQDSQLPTYYLSWPNMVYHLRSKPHLDSI